MKRQLVYSILLVFSILLIVGCGTDNKENPPEADGPYSFFNATTPLEIFAPVEVNGTIVEVEYKVSVQLLEFGLVKPGESVEMKPFDLKYGFVTNTVVTTDTNGNANFIYNVPEDYSKVKGEEIIIQAVYLDSDSDATTTSSAPRAPNVLLTQDFVLQFR